MAVTKLPMPITEAAGTVTVAVAPLGGKSAAPMAASTTFCTRKETVPVGAGPAGAPGTEAGVHHVLHQEGDGSGGRGPGGAAAHGGREAHGIVRSGLRWIGGDGGGAGGAGIPLGDQVVGVDGAEAGGQIVSRSGRVTHQALYAVRTEEGATHAVIAGGDVVEYVVGGLCQAVERGVDVAQSGFRQDGFGSEVVIEEGDHAGHGRRGGRSAADDIEAAVEIDLVARMVGGGGEGNIGDVAGPIVGHARA